jgi:hypothetical protein
MSPTDPSGPEKLAPVILDRMAEILMDEYEGRFFDAYKRAVMARDNRRPLEPADEMRNAFDHLSLATRRAFTIDMRPLPLDPRETREITDPRESAYLNLDQARRHLAIGRYYCCEHQIVGLIECIAAAVADMSKNAKSAEAPLRQRAEELDNKFQRIGGVVIEGIYSSAEINTWLQGFEVKIDELTRLTNELARLLLDIKQQQSSPAS